VTDVQEEYTKPFANYWTGDGGISGAGGTDGEKILLGTGDSMESNVWYLGAGAARITLDKYGSGEGIVDIKYKTGITVAACEADTWHDYVSGFICLNYVKVQLNY